MMLGSRRMMVRSADEGQVRRQFHGSIDGVHFDLRHPSLPPAEWSCPRFFTGRSPDHPGYYLAHRPVGDNPPEWWPLESAEAMQEVIDQAEQNAREQGMEMLYPGDRVSIAAVAKQQPPNWKLAPPPDQEMAVVSLQVTRFDGSLEPLQARTFYRRGSTLGGFEEWEVSSHLFDRLWPLVSEGDREAWEVFDLSERAERERLALHDFLMERVPSGPLQGLLDPRFHVAASLDMLFNLAALYGYRQGRLEADRAMGPLARQTMERTEANRENASRHREPARAELAQQVWVEMPQATVNRVAGEVVVRLAQRGIRAEQANVARSIARWCPETSPSYRTVKGSPGYVASDAAHHSDAATGDSRAARAASRQA